MAPGSCRRSLGLRRRLDCGRRRSPGLERAVADLDTVSVATSNPDGTLRYTTIWIVVVEGRAYLRTGDTTWGENVARDPDVKLVIDDKEYSLRADFVEADDERALVTAAFNQKYGWSDTMISWFRGARPKIMRLASL